MTKGWSTLIDFGFEHIDLWRSEPMQLVSLMLPSESAHETMHALGEIGLLQFKDLNADKSAYQRNYASQVRRCDEMTRRLKFFQDQVDKSGVAIKAMPIGGEKNYTFDELEAKLEDLEKELVETNNNMERLQRSHAELNEMQLVLENAGKFFDARTSARLASSADDGFGGDGSSPLLEAAGGDKVTKVGFVAGTIARDKVLAFERLLFRVTRGNVLLRQTDVGKIKDPSTGEDMEKVVFCVFFAGDRAHNKIQKICEVFSANKYPFPEDIARQKQMATEVSGRLRELLTTNEAGERRRDVVLKEIAYHLASWTTMVRKEKAVYHTLNKFSVDVTSKVLIGEAWAPTYAREQVQDALAHTGQASHTQLAAVMQTLSATDAPPTYFRTNKFTDCFQTIVNAYGTARYREVNPTVLTLMTFPFLFAVMFGDVGHALIMIAVAAFLIHKEKALAGKDLGDMLSMLFGGRYCVLLMGLFSVYTGLIYNEFFSMPMQIFGPTGFRCWKPYTSEERTERYEGYAPKDFYMANCQVWDGQIIWPYRGQFNKANEITGTPAYITPGTVLEDSHVYYFGVDPIWHGRKTELPYFNSLKMKMSIIMGVLHMDAGIMNSLYNNLYFRDMLSTVWEFIPQMIFLNSIFGYLCILIITKWCSTGATEQYADLYHVMIYMFLSPGSMDVQGQLFNGQGTLQVFLLLIAFIAVPCMLLPKPLILKKRHEEAQRARGSVELSHTVYSQSDDHEHGGGHGHGHGEHGEFDFGEVMVHQMIHTIEFVLGAVSNTASYLRLWALSLAHSQLSSVFYDRVLMMTITMGSIPAMIVGFFVFACATLGVLMVMESLSAFLHALRLHWVEYMNKFYKGDGYMFSPFCFKAVLSAKEDDEK